LSSFAFHFCDWTIAITLLMIPASMFGTPKDFWPVALGATVTTGIACIFMTVQVARQLPDTPAAQAELTFKSFFEAFGTILFSFGGGVIFPTVQSDMINPSKFPKSVVGAYSSI
jgi:solute carrier family 32 (vesicular inhibitory amino acid transporter)